MLTLLLLLSDGSWWGQATRFLSKLEKAGGDEALYAAQHFSLLKATHSRSAQLTSSA